MILRLNIDTLYLSSLKSIFQILKRTNNIFELISHNAICNGEGQSFEDNDDHSDKKIQLKGSCFCLFSS